MPDFSNWLTQLLSALAVLFTTMGAALKFFFERRKSKAEAGTAEIKERSEEFAFVRQQITALRDDLKEALNRNEELSKRLDEMEREEIKRATKLQQADTHIEDLYRAIRLEPGEGEVIFARLVTKYTPEARS